MTGTEAEAARLSGEPIELLGVIYSRLIRIFHEEHNGEDVAIAELADRTGRSTTVAPIKYIKKVSQEQGADR